MELAADLLAEQADQVVLARVQTAADLRADFFGALAFHLAQAAQTRSARRGIEQAFFDEHDDVRLVERVHRRQHLSRVRAVKVLQLRQHLLAQANAGGAIAAVFG